MNRTQVRGKWDELKGRFKRILGRATGDRSTELKGGLREGVGQVKTGVGNVQESFRRPDSPAY
jgi:uncharacterized protein YjbJ (UPF0337 family)